MGFLVSASGGLLFRPGLVLKGGVELFVPKYTSSYSLTVQKYLGNSFYVEAGIGLGRKDFSSIFCVFSCPPSGSQKSFVLGSAISTGLGIKWSIGNQWTWKSGFTLGVGYASGFNELIRVSDASVSYRNGTEPEVIRDFEKTIEETSIEAMNIFNVHLGFNL